jgi:hypothetical protein
VKIGPKTSLEMLAAIISEALERNGIDAVLCGGAVVSIYSHNEYESNDLDFVTSDGMRAIGDVMTELGFSRGQRRFFTHPRTDFSVEFPAGPVMVGDERVTQVARRKTRAGTVRMLTPTDAVKDRLAAFLHWNDRQGVEQALQIIRKQTVSFLKVDRWAQSEPGSAKDRYALVRETIRAATEKQPSRRR